MGQTSMNSIIPIFTIWISLWISLVSAPLGRIWERVDSHDGVAAVDFCVINDTIFAVGNGGAIWRTNDRANWNAEQTRVSQDLKAIVQGNGTIIAVGNGGRILRSDAGGLWTVEPSGTTWALKGVTFANGMFVAVGDKGVIIYSYEGKKWYPLDSGITSNLNDIIWDNQSSQFYAVGRDATILSGTPGGSWVKLSHPLNKTAEYKNIVKSVEGFNIDGWISSIDGVEWQSVGSTSQNAVAYGADRFVSTGNGGMISVSDDALQWKSIKTNSNEDLIGVKWTGEDFLALTVSLSLLSSEDGLRWRGLGLHGSGTNYAGCWTGDQYVVVGGASIKTSPDGKWWSSENHGVTSSLYTVSAGNGNIVAAGEMGTLLHSQDGRLWEKMPMIGIWTFLKCHWTGTEFILGGTEGVILTSADGRTWTLKSPGRLDACVWDGTRYLAFSGKNVLQSSDGNEWQILSTVATDELPWGRDVGIRDIVWTGTYYVAVGDGGLFFRSADGLNWTKGKMTGNISSMRAVLWSGSRYIATGADFFNYYSDDGLTWTVMGNGDPSSRHQSIAWNGVQFMGVAGDMIRTSPDGINWTLIAKRNITNLNLQSIVWTGTEWITCGRGMGTRGVVSSSVDGVNWVDSWSPELYGLYVSLASHNGTTVAIGKDGVVKRYVGGVWHDEQIPLAGDTPVVIPGKDSVLAFSKTATSAWLDDEQAWVMGDRRVIATTIRAIASGNGMLVIGFDVSGNSGNFLATSLDGNNWESGLFGWAGTTFIDMIWTGTEFHGLAANDIYSSSDGSIWSVKDAYGAECEAWFNGHLLLGGRFTDLTDTGTYPLVKTMTGDSGDDASYSPGVRGNGVIRDLIVGPSEILAIGTGDTMISKDGFNWSVQSVPQISGSLRDVVHTPLGFFAAGDAGAIWHSPEGEIWTKKSVIGMPQINALHWADGKLVGVGDGTATTSDGVNWIFTGVPVRTFLYSDVVWGNGKFVAVAKQSISTSSDGENWTRIAMNFAFDAVQWSGVEFLATTSDGGMLRSQDGISWVFTALPGNLVAVAYGNGYYMAGNAAGMIFRSVDAENWSLCFDPRNQVTAGPMKIYFEGDKFFANFSTLSFVSDDGAVWNLGSTHVTIANAAVWTGNRFIGLSVFGTVYTSLDAQAWSQIEGFHSVDIRQPKMIWTGDQMIAVGNSGKAFSSPDGKNWTRITTGTTQNLIDVVWVGEQAVALAQDGSIICLGSGGALLAGEECRDICAYNGKLHAALSAGRMAILEEGEWQIFNVGTSKNINQLTLNASGGITAVGDSGAVTVRTSESATSPWSLISQSPLAKISLVQSGVFIHVGSSGKVARTYDGRTWEDLLPYSGRTFSGAWHSGSDLFAVGSGGSIVRIRPGNTNVDENSRTTVWLNSIAGTSDRLVSVGDKGVILLSKAGFAAGSGYEHWISSQSSSERDGPMEEDPNEDGIPNLLSYVYGLPAISSTLPEDREILPQLLSSNEGPELVFEMFTEIDDVEVRVDQTQDLVNWVTVAEKVGMGSWGGSAKITEEEGTDGRKRIKVQETRTVPAVEKSFYRMRVKLR